MDSFWNFLSVVVIALVTQRLIAWREGKKKLKEEQLDIYLATVKPLSYFYEAALEKPLKTPASELYRQHIEIMSTLSIMGTESVMEAFHNFSEYVFDITLNEKEVEETKLRSLLSEVTALMCCDIHGEKL